MNDRILTLAPLAFLAAACQQAPTSPSAHAAVPPEGLLLARPGSGSQPLTVALTGNVTATSGSVAT